MMAKKTQRGKLLDKIRHLRRKGFCFDGIAYTLTMTPGELHEQISRIRSVAKPHVKRWKKNRTRRIQKK